MEQVVQVQIAGARKSYAYAWNGDGELQLGDWVALPGNVVSEDGSEGMVTGFGADGYTGPLKEVTERRERPNLWVAQMEAVQTKEQARAIWRKAKEAGVTGAKMDDLIDAGKARLGELARAKEAAMRMQNRAAAHESARLAANEPSNWPPTVREVTGDGAADRWA